MPRIALWVADHRDHDWQPDGEIIKVWKLDPDEPPGERYADFRALYTYWAFCHAHGEWPEIVGFFGYRKYLCPIDGDLVPEWVLPAHAPDWWWCYKEDFDDYRQWLVDWDGADIKRLLAQYDILQAPPFPLTEGIWTDFARSRSHEDAQHCKNVMSDRFEHFTDTKIYPYIFITRWSVFDRMMRELEPVRKELDPLITAADSVNSDYTKRPMAYVMERLYSLWLEASDLSIRTMPLLHCWEMSQ